MVATLEVDRAVVAVVAVPLEVVAVAMARVAVVVPVVVIVVLRPVLIPLRGSRAGEKHESGGDQTGDAELHGWTLIVRDAPRLHGPR